MSYLAQSQLAGEADFANRVRAANVQQAMVFKDDQRADFVALSNALLMDSAGPVNAFIRLAAAGPGIADKAETGPGVIDSSLVTDEDLLALTQANYPVVAGLFFPETG